MVAGDDDDNGDEEEEDGEEWRGDGAWVVVTIFNKLGKRPCLRWCNR